VNRRGWSLRLSLFLLVLFVPLSGGCVHRIHVAPVPSTTAEKPILSTVQVIVPFLAVEGADHMPGIALFDWPAKDLQAAAIDYIGKRHTFTSVSESQGNLILTMKSWLTMRSKEEYRYLLRFESDLGPAGKPPIKSYLVEKEESGSAVRWVTASDQDPIQRAVQAGLDDLLAQIEADASLYQKRTN
jgi:hypothetical protein